MSKIKKQIKEASKQVNIIIRNRLIIAILSIIDGISFLIFEGKSITTMAKTIAITVLIAACSAIITNLTSKEKDIKSVIISIITCIFCVFAFFVPNIVLPNLKLILALFIITNGIINILNVTKFNQITNTILNKQEKAKSKIETIKKNKEFEDGIRSQTNKIIVTINKTIDKTASIPYLYIIINIISISLGLLLFTYPDITVIVWGIVFIYTGLIDFILAARSMNLKEKLKKKEFKEILLS